MIDRVEKEVEMLERRFETFRQVLENEPIGIVRLSDSTGHPHHKVRYSLRVLEEQGIIEPTAQGAVPTDQTREFITDFDSRIETIIDQLKRLRTSS